MRSPRVVTTVACAALGIGSHVTLDWFTHPGRPGERWLGYDDVEVTLFGVTEPLAGVLQVLGHSVGSLVALWMLWIIADRRLLETWYGERPVAIARRRPASTTARIEFSSIVTIGASLGFAWGRGDEFVEWVQRSAVGVGVGCVVGAAVVSSFARVDEGDVGVSR